MVASPEVINQRLDAIELTLSGIGTAAYRNTEFFISSSQFDIYKANLASPTGASNIGYGSSTVADALDSTTSSLQVVVHTVEELRALPKVGVYNRAVLSGSNTGGGTGNFYLDLSDNTTTDDGGITYVNPSDGARWKREVVGSSVNLSWFDTRGTEVSGAFIRAAKYLLSKPRPGGTINVDGDYTLAAGLVNFWDILALAQNITTATNYYPNGELVRGTFIGLQGTGYNRSRLKITGSGKAFTWGYFSAIDSKRAMSCRVDRIDFEGPGVMGHTSQVIIPGAQGFSTTTVGNAGTTNIDTTCLYLAEVVPGSSVTNCRFRYFQEGVNQRYGFGFVADGNDTQYCNIGYLFDAGVTTWSIRDGNEIEVCGIGIFSRQTVNGYIGAAVIEANLAGCDILVYCSKYITSIGTWFEGSNKNVVLRGDIFSAILPNSNITFIKAIGLNVDSNGGVVNFLADRCAMNLLGEKYAVSTGERFRDVLYQSCTVEAGLEITPFDMSSITLDGAPWSGIKVTGSTANGKLDDVSSRSAITKKGLTTTTSTTPVKAFSILVGNSETTARIEITGYKRASQSDSMQVQSYKYVGVLQRFVGGSTVIQFSTTESVVSSYSSTGSNSPISVASPTVTVTGAETAQQTVQFNFPTGVASGATAWSMWEVKINNESDAIKFE